MLCAESSAHQRPDNGKHPDSAHNQTQNIRVAVVNVQERVLLPARIHHIGAAETGDLRVDRLLVQRTPSTFRDRPPQPARIRASSHAGRRNLNNQLSGIWGEPHVMSSRRWWVPWDPGVLGLNGCVFPRVGMFETQLPWPRSIEFQSTTLILDQPLANRSRAISTSSARSPWKRLKRSLESDRPRTPKPWTWKASQ